MVSTHTIAGGGKNHSSFYQPYSLHTARASASLGEVLVPLASPSGLVCPEGNNFPHHLEARLYKKDTKWYLTILETLMAHLREEGFSCWGVVVHRHRRDVLIPEKKIHTPRKLPLGNGSFGGNGRVFSTIGKKKMIINKDPIFLAAVSWTIAEVQHAQEPLGMAHRWSLCVYEVQQVPSTSGSAWVPWASPLVAGRRHTHFFCSGKNSWWKKGTYLKIWWDGNSCVYVVSGCPVILICWELVFVCFKLKII